MQSESESNDDQIVTEEFFNNMENLNFTHQIQKVGTPSKSKKCKRILIVDDEPYNVLALQFLITHLNISGLLNIVDRAYNGLEAFKKVKDSYLNGSHIYGLILTDISMPVMDGFEASQQIRSFYRSKQITQPLIVACTGHIEPSFAQRAWANEIDEIVPKPINIEILSSIMDEILLIEDQ